MEFIQKAEDFVRQMSNSLAFDPEPVYVGKKGPYGMMIPPEEFLNIIDTHKIDYPFKPEIKIIELKGLMKTEGIEPIDAIKVVKNYVDHYWVMDVVQIPDHFYKKIASIVKKDEGSDKRVLKEQANYTEYCKSIRQKYFEELMTELGLTAEIANELGFPDWLKIKNLSANIDFPNGGSLKFNPNEDGDIHIDFNNDDIADAFIEYGNTKNKKSLTEEEKAEAKKKFSDAIQNQKDTLNKVVDEAKEASDRSFKSAFFGTSDNNIQTPLNNFKEQVDLFFKQYHTVLGVQREFKAYFRSKIETHTDPSTGEPAKNADGKPINKFISSNRLPFDYTPEEASAYGSNTPLDKPWQDVMDKHEVDKKWERNVKIIDIKRAMESEKYSFHDAMVIIETKKNKYWNQYGPIVIPDEIKNDTKVWLEKRKKEGLESYEPQKIFDNISNIFKARREFNYDKLITAIKGENITRTLREDEKQVKTPDADKQTASPEKESTEVFHFENNFDHVDSEKVYDYFNEKLVKNGNLTEDVFRKYLITAFQESNITKDRKEEDPIEKPFRFNGKIKKTYIYTTYRYYQMEIAGQETGSQARIAKLVGHYFRDFKSKTVYANLNNY